MRLGGRAKYLMEIHDRAELATALTWAKENNLSVIMIGDGSNIVWQDTGFDGLVLVNKIMGYEQLDEDTHNTYLTVGGGENWDNVVERSVQAGLTGIEALSLIPGTTGATPIQNVGAYGQDISQTLSSLEVYDSQTGQFINMPVMDCGFGYRTSRFKTTDKGRFFITSITLHLTKGNLQPPFYDTLQRYLDEHDIHEFTPAAIREAVIAIRSSRLPDPATVANNGSFFANPIINVDLLTQLLAAYPAIPHWATDDETKVKIPAAWLVDQAGFKDYHDSETGMATWPPQALVFVNEHAKSTADLLKFKQKVIDAVEAKFHITLVQEPELLP